MLKLSLTNQHKAEKLLSDLLDVLELIVCRRCYRETYHLKQPYHHHGGLLYLLSKSKLNPDHINNWIFDTEHGVLHGIMTLLFALTYIDREKFIEDISIDRSPFTLSTGVTIDNYNNRSLDAERLVMECLFHDFLKCQGIHPHDSKLKEIFNYFNPIVYEHSDPQNSDYPLVMADRAELLRFPNANEWVDQSKLDLRIPREMIDYFNSHIRPIMEKVILHRNDVWFSHMLEEGKIEETYPNKHWLPVDPGLEDQPTHNGYSVNCGYLPFNGCLAHTWKSFHKMGRKSIIGLIQKNSMTKVAAPPLSCWGRDHLFLTESINTKEWIFLYDGNFDTSQINAININLFNRFIKIYDNLIAKIKATN